jgi:hypothetical protein
MALSLLFVCVRRERLAYLYFSSPMDLEGTVATAALTDAIPMAVGDPTKRAEIRQVPTRLSLELAEQPGIRFQVMLPEDPTWMPPHIAAGERIVLRLPSRWRDVLVGNRALVIGLRRRDQVLVDPDRYSYADESRTLFLGVGAAVGALIAGLSAWRIGHLTKS